MSAAETVVVPRSFRFRFVLLLVSMCCLNALLRTIFPEAVRLNRFAAPRCVFNFGMELVLSLSMRSHTSCVNFSYRLSYRKYAATG